MCEVTSANQQVSILQGIDGEEIDGFGRSKLSEQNQNSQRKSMERDLTAGSNSDEPNFLIYNMIKEMDYLVESHQQQ